MSHELKNQLQIIMGLADRIDNQRDWLFYNEREGNSTLQQEQEINSLVFQLQVAVAGYEQQTIKEAQEAGKL